MAAAVQPAATATSACPTLVSAISMLAPPLPTVFASQLAAASTDPCATVGIETVSPRAYLSYLDETDAWLVEHQDLVQSVLAQCTAYLSAMTESALALTSSCLVAKAAGGGAAKGAFIAAAATTTTAASPPTGLPMDLKMASRVTMTVSYTPYAAASRSAASSVRKTPLGLLAGAVLVARLLAA